MVTSTLEKEVTNYWERTFSYDESVERIKGFEWRTVEGKVWCGVELHWAKLKLGHGEFYPYLAHACLDPTTAWRRMKLATKFIVWAGITDKKKPEEIHIIQAMSLIDAKSFILKDFKDYLDKENEPQRIDELRKAAAGGTESPDTKEHILGVSLLQLRELLDRIYRTIGHDYLDWSAIERQEAQDTLRLFAQQLMEVEEAIGNVAALSPNAQIEKVKRLAYEAQHPDIFGTKQDREEHIERVIQQLRDRGSEGNEPLIRLLEQELAVLRERNKGAGKTDNTDSEEVSR